MKKETKVNYICEICNRSFTNQAHAEECEATCKAKRDVLIKKQRSEEMAKKQAQCEKDKAVVQEAFDTFQKILANFEAKYPDVSVAPMATSKKSVTPHAHSVNIPPFAPCNGKCKGSQGEEMTEADFEKIMLSLFPQLFK